jgi:hypothetical protein
VQIHKIGFSQTVKNHVFFWRADTLIELIQMIGSFPNAERRRGSFPNAERRRRDLERRREEAYAEAPNTIHRSECNCSRAVLYGPEYRNGNGIRLSMKSQIYRTQDFNDIMRDAEYYIQMKGYKERFSKVRNMANGLRYVAHMQYYPHFTLGVQRYYIPQDMCKGTLLGSSNNCSKILKCGEDYCFWHRQNVL